MHPSKFECENPSPPIIKRGAFDNTMHPGLLG